jgi:hypothetical protein
VIGIIKRLRDRPNDAPMPTERLLDDAADIIEELLTFFIECVDDLESEIESRRGSVLERIMARDLDPIIKARSFIQKVQGDEI